MPTFGRVGLLWGLHPSLRFDGVGLASPGQAQCFLFPSVTS